MHDKEKDSDICCPQFDPSPWDEKTIIWNDKLFIMDTISQIFHMPLPWVFGKKIGRLWKVTEEADATPDIKDFLMLSYDPSPWKSELYLAVTKEVTGEKNVKLSGTFMTKVFDGPYNDVPKWIKIMDTYVTAQGKKTLRYYFYFTTCPKCAKKYGHNYVVVFSQIE